MSLSPLKWLAFDDRYESSQVHDLCLVVALIEDATQVEQLVLICKLLLEPSLQLFLSSSSCLVVLVMVQMCEDAHETRHSVVLQHA